jgi:tetratricopeptide (TPR) repeat protein
MDEGTLTLAQHYLDISRPDRALETIDSGSVDVSDIEFWRIRAAALLGVGRYGEARNAAMSGLGLEPDDITLLATHALAAANLHDVAGAERSLLAALRVDPENAWLLAQYARLVGSHGQLDKAKELIEAAGRSDPESDTVRQVRGFLSYLAADDATAARHAEEALAADPEEQSAHLLRGVVLAHQGRVRDARRHFDTAARRAPGDAGIVEAAHEIRWLTHPLLLPLVPIQRFGAGRVWLAGLALIGITWAIGNEILQMVVLVAWLAYVTYSWVAPPLVRRWYERGRR